MNAYMLVEPRDGASRDRDRALVEAHCAGDRSVFPVIVREHYRALHAHAYRRLGNPVEAEDAVQEAFERAYRGLCRLDGEYRIGAWLHRIVANVCTDHVARRNVQRALPERIGAEHTTAPDAADHASDPVVFRAVQDALNALPASQRQTFWLYEMSGLTYPEVAEQLGITEDNARARVHRARTALRRSLSRVRDAVAAVIMLPFGVRALRNGDGGSATTAAAPQQATVAHAAYLASASPVTELAASAASHGPGTVAVVAASVAAVVGAAFAAPAVTNSPSSSSPPAATAVAAPAVINAGGSGSDTTVATSVDATTDGAATAATVPATAPASRPPFDEPDQWLIAGAEATDISWVTRPGDESGLPAVDACPWLADYPGLRASLKGVSPTTDAVDPASGTDAAVSVAFSVATSLRVTDPETGEATEVPVVIRAQACLEEGVSALVADVEGPRGKGLALRAPKVTQLSATEIVFRGAVTALGGDGNTPIPWGLSNRFMAILTVDPGTQTVALKVAFLEGLLDATPTTTTTTPPEETDPTTTTTGPGSDDPIPTSTTLPTSTSTAPGGSDGSSDGDPSP